MRSQKIRNPKENLARLDFTYNLCKFIANNGELMRKQILSKLIALSAIAIFTSGCATSNQTVGPNGLPAHSIACGAMNPQSCLEKAGEVCPSGDTVINSSAAKNLGQVQSGSVGGGWNKYGGSIFGSAQSTPLYSANTLLVQCKASPISRP